MIGANVETLPDKVGEVRESFRKFAVRQIYRMSGYQRAIERSSMLQAPKGQHSPAGTPPFTHPRTSKAGNTLPAFPNFIQFKVEENGFQSRSVVGPTKPSKGRRSNWAERIGNTHEFGGTSTVEKRGVLVGGVLMPHRVRLYVGNRKTFNFTILEQKSTNRHGVTRTVLKISHQATYPKRPFAAPALRKTIAATKQGKFGQ